MRKKTVKRVVAKRPKKGTKKRSTRTGRSGVSKRIKARQQKHEARPVIEETVVDMVDQPLPGVVRLTEIEEMEVSVPDPEEEE